MATSHLAICSQMLLLRARLTEPGNVFPVYCEVLISLYEV